MNGGTFDTFNAHPGCQEALGVCRAVAALAYGGPFPVLLLGPEGAGKSHLLWSIVDAARSGEKQIGLGLVLADEFPNQVRDLVRNPAPIQTGDPAILLVDELDSFYENATDLEAVVELFLEQGHPVVLASRIPPEGLDTFTPSFHQLVSRGRKVHVEPDAVATDLDWPGESAGGMAEGLEAELALLRAERDSLETKLAEKARQVADSAGLQEELERARAEAVRFKAELADTSKMEALAVRHEKKLDALNGELLAARDALDAACHERDELEVRLAERAGTEVVSPEIRQRIEEAETSAEVALAEKARLEDLLHAKGQVEEELAQARVERDAASQAAVELTVRLEDAIQRLLALMDTAMARTLVSAEGLEDFVARFRSLQTPPAGSEVDHQQAELTESRRVADALQGQLEQDRRRFEEEVEALRSEGEHTEQLLEEARAEQGRQGVLLDGARGRLRAVEFELEKSRKQISLQIAEMDALRHEAASQVASANIQAGEMERRIVHLESAVDVARATAGSAESDAGRLSDELLHAAETLRSLAERQSTLKKISAQLPPPSDPEDDQPNLFEEAVLDPRDFPLLPPESEVSELPPPRSSAAASLREVVEEALSAPEPPDSEPME